MAISSLYLKTIACLAIAMVLWLNAAYLDHQYDLANTDHTEHHCQLLATALHGASAATPCVLSMPVGNKIESPTPYHFSPMLAFAYLARSPPILSHT
ncbi:DUF2607 family protein [Vibrio sinaloensis]|uniref:DUF2607 family protein n=1 Tax=Photobacterium sp. (strain ATCC 43367) TaxID=379097 RepID=UPI0020707474|nr:DUF2607 family protein [Vibrio sinaloensis]UPQ88266.1 DUF2607 domain-containing protein [Vibrio sinaloensis]